MSTIGPSLSPAALSRAEGFLPQSSSASPVSGSISSEGTAVTGNSGNETVPSTSGRTSSRNSESLVGQSNDTSSRTDPFTTQGRPSGDSTDQAEGTAQETGTPPESNPTELTDEEVREVQELRARDRVVRQHEQAHIAAGGPFIRGGPTFTFETGPDGRQYAVGGEVSIDTSKEATPERTLIKAQTVRRAALAPAEPSGQDRAVAAKASQLEAQARREISLSRLPQVESSGTGSLPSAESGSSGNPVPAAGPSETSVPSAQNEVGQLVDLIG